MAERRTGSSAVRFALALGAMLAIVATLVYLVRPSEDIRTVDPGEPPEFEREVFVAADGDTLAPFGLALCLDTLWVAFKDDPRVAGLDSQFSVVRWVTLQQTTMKPPLATGWDADSLCFYRVDHRGAAVEVFDRDGRLQQRWDRRPDGQPLLPFSMDLFSGNLYVGDVASGRVMAISMRNDTPLTERGELILTIPGFDQPDSLFGFISGVTCTPDGRLLVGDSDPAGIRVFTCDGRAVYSFRQPVEPPLAARQVAFDGVQFPDLVNKNEFDPSGVVAIGRLHVVDARRNMVYVYDPLGEWRFCYGTSEGLSFPNAIVARPEGRQLIIADTGNRRLAVYRW